LILGPLDSGAAFTRHAQAKERSRKILGQDQASRPH
jgi:hypothetical protein